jgi:hypothetical protein
MKAADAKQFIGKQVEYAYKHDNYPRGAKVLGTRGRNIQVEFDWLWAPDIAWMRLAPSEVVSEQRRDSTK